MEENELKEQLKELDKVLGSSDTDVEKLVESLGSIKNRLNVNDRLLDSLEKISEHNDDAKKILQTISTEVKDSKFSLPESVDVNVKNPVGEVKVSNLDEIKIPEPSKELKVNNVKEFPEYSKELETLSKLIARLVVKAESNKAMEIDLDRYLDAKRPLSVRLSDGRNFYQAIAHAISQAMESTPRYVKSLHKAVATATTRVQLESYVCQSVTIKALHGNTGSIYVGGSDVAAANGFVLLKDESISLAIDNTNKIYIDASVNGEGVSYILVN